MSAKYSGRIHDPNHVRSEYDIYFNDELINAGVPDPDQFIGLITRTATRIDIPDGVEIIGANAFRALNSAEKIIIPDSVKRLEAGSFSYIRGTEKHLNLYLPAGITYIDSSVFNVSSGIDTVYCGFSENSISGAPWGAPINITFVYDQDRPEGM